MNTDLSATTGFALGFDPVTLDLATSAEMQFNHQFRTVADLQAVLRSPEAADPKEIVYHLYMPQRFPPEVQATLDRFSLTYSLVGMPVGSIGGEFVKTSGHYHPWTPGTDFAFPEIYTQLGGRLLLLLQKRGLGPDGVIEDCRLVEMTPGFTLIVPSGYSHVLINPYDEPALMAGLYSTLFKPEYGAVRTRRGLAYYIMANGESFAVEPNPAYETPPPLIPLKTLAGTQFFPPHPDQPVWQAFLEDPEQYAFLSQPNPLKEPGKA